MTDEEREAYYHEQRLRLWAPRMFDEERHLHPAPAPFPAGVSLHRQEASPDVLHVAIREVLRGEPDVLRAAVRDVLRELAEKQRREG